jgi:hypothetical protein
MVTNPKLLIEDLLLPPGFPETRGRIGHVLTFDEGKEHDWDSTDQDSTIKLIGLIKGLACKQPMDRQQEQLAVWDGGHLLILGDGLPFPGLWAKEERHGWETTIGGWTQNLVYDSPEALADLAEKVAQTLLDGRGVVIFDPNGYLASYLLLALTHLANEHSHGFEGARAIWKERPQPEFPDLECLSPAQEKALWCLKAGRFQNAKGTGVPSVPRGGINTYSQFVSDDSLFEPEQKAKPSGVYCILFDENVLAARHDLMERIRDCKLSDWSLEMAIDSLIHATLKATLVHGQEAMEGSSPWDLD